MARTSRYVQVCKKALKWFAKPENFGKSLKECANAIGVEYDTLRHYIWRYGRQKFYQEYAEIYQEILEEAKSSILAWLHQKATDPNTGSYDKWRASTHLREWEKVLQGIKIKAEHSGTIQHDVLVNFVNEARERAERISRMVSEGKTS